MIVSPFPKKISFVTVALDAVSVDMLPDAERQALSPRARTKRIQEFTAGRVAARQALINAGCSHPPALLIGESRMPLWPHGYLGSISHSNGLAIACAAPSATIRTIGLDIEHIERNVDLRIQERITTDSEMNSLPADRYTEFVRMLLLFSAKETIYKAYFPVVGTYFGYDSVELRYDTLHHCLRITPLLPALKSVIGADARIGFSITDEFVFTYCWNEV